VFGVFDVLFWMKIYFLPFILFIGCGDA